MFLLWPKWARVITCKRWSMAGYLCQDKLGFEGDLKKEKGEMVGGGKWAGEVALLKE